MSNITLYSYFRSSCSWRVRIALNLLNIEHEIKHVNLLKNEQNSEWYRRINPLGTVPALTSPSLESPIWQSLAIIDFLDKEQSLLPQDPMERARCLEIALTIVAEIQPLQNLSVMNRVAQLGGQEEKMKWALEHNRSKLGILEKMISGKSNFSVSNQISLADICIVPQLYSAQRFGINLSKEFPGLLGKAKKLERIDAFERAHAHSQADCPNDLRESPKYF
jgi:maleylacetoacetate isomerase